MLALLDSLMPQNLKIYPEIIISILEDAKASNKERISLVDVIWEYDRRNKLMPLLEEINEALKTITWVNTTKVGEEVFLGITPEQTSYVVISESDFHLASKEYSRRFWKAYKNLKQIFRKMRNHFSIQVLNKSILPV